MRRRFNALAAFALLATTLAASPPVDIATEAMRREAKAQELEREEIFARLSGVLVPDAPPPPRRVLGPAVGGGVVEVQKLIQPFPAAEMAPVLDANFRAVRLNNVKVARAVNPQLTAQFEAQFRCILRAEYQLTLLTCDPTKDQRREIARAGEQALKDAAKKAVEWQQGSRVLTRNGMLDNPDPRKIIQDALAAAVKKHLSSEQAARYHDEVHRRAADQKRAAILNLVAKLDQMLLLSLEQREKITEVLSRNWNDGWYATLQTSFLNDTYAPPVSVELISPLLSPAQLKAWHGTMRVNRVLWNGFVTFTGAEENTPLEDAALNDTGPTPKLQREDFSGR